MITVKRRGETYENVSMCTEPTRWSLVAFSEKGGGKGKPDFGVPSTILRPPVEEAEEALPHALSVDSAGRPSFSGGECA